jgi:D-tyrosyl-tRNA(Tyr) deacylase
VAVEGRIKGEIGRGLVVFLGVGQDDTEADARYLAGKISGLRIFEDNQGKLNLSILDIGGAVLVVSQFTLYGDCRQGRRPSFTAAAGSEEANILYELFVAELAGLGVRVATGCFQTVMQVELVNDGPVTLLLDSKKNF